MDMRNCKECDQLLKSKKHWILCGKSNSVSLTQKILYGLNGTMTVIAILILICGMIDVKETKSTSITYSSITIGVLMLLLGVLGFCIIWLIKMVKVHVFFVYSILLMLSSLTDLIMTGLVSSKVAQSNTCKGCQISGVLVTLAIIFAISCIFQLFSAVFTCFIIKEIQNIKCPEHSSHKRCDKDLTDNNSNYMSTLQTGSEYKSDYTEVVFHDPRFSISSSIADKHYKSYSYHQSIDDSMSSRAKRQGIAFLDSDDVNELHQYTHPDRSKSCDNLSTPIREIKISLVNGQLQESLLQVNVDPDISAHVPHVEKPLKTSYTDNMLKSSYRSSQASDFCRMDIGDFKNNCSRNCDDSVFLDMHDAGYFMETNVNHTSFQSEIIGRHYSSMIESEKDTSYREYNDHRTRRRSRYSSDYLHSIQNTSAPNLRGKVYKKKLSKQRIQMMPSKESPFSPVIMHDARYASNKDYEMNTHKVEHIDPNSNKEDFDRSDANNKRASFKRDGILPTVSAKVHPIPSMIAASLPGIHFGDKMLSVNKDAQQRAKSMEVLHTNFPDFCMAKRPSSVAEGVFQPPLTRAESSTQTLMKSIFSGTYWKEQAPDNSISSFDGFNSLMTSKSSLVHTGSFQRATTIGSVSKDESSVLSKSCSEINNTTESSGFGRSFLRKSVIDPSVVQSFQRSLHLTQTPYSIRTNSGNFYTTPEQSIDKLEVSQLESSLSSYHSAQPGGNSTKKHPSDEQNSHDLADISIPSYNFDQQLDNCLNQMMVLAAELQNQENSQIHNEAGVEVSPLMSRKSRSYTNISAYIRPQSRESMTSVGRPHSVNSHISTVYRPKSRDSGSVTSQCSAGINNSRFSADSMII